MYTWMDYPNAEIWNHDCFETIEECIQDAKDNYKIDSDMIYVGECKDVSIGGIDLDDILCRVEEDMYEQVGEVSEGWDIYSTSGSYADRKPIYDKYNEKLRQLVMDYIEEIGEKPSFYKIVNVKEIKIGEVK